jgi:threonine dehydrogenase-like Zn-dependent dehydrogenase
LAQKQNAQFEPYNPSKEKLAERFDYFVIMAPAPVLAAQSIEAAAPHAVINIFAGIPAEVTFPLDLDTYIERQLYFVGTSGSVLENMKQVLAKVVARRLDTDLSVAAVAGLEGAIDGIRAVETNAMPGKILVYPSCTGLKLTPLSELGIPLLDGRWNESAEKALLNRFAAP